MPDAVTRFEPYAVIPLCSTEAVTPLVLASFMPLHKVA